MTPSIDLRCCDVADLLASLPDGAAAAVFADPPWGYEQTAVRGNADDQYGGMTEPEIAAHLIAAYRVAAEDTYLAVWATWPKLGEWMAVSVAPWVYVTGGAWGKTNGLGVGHHFRGDSEPLLLYRKGSPKPLGGSKSNLWLAPRVGHSEKPQTALRALVSMGAPPGGLVCDLYAGASASLARACRALGRAYVGAELDPARHARALVRLSQQEMAWEVPA